MDPSELEKAVLEKLMTVMDPETHIDVIRMQLVQDLNIDNTGYITYTFRPSSPLCPIAVPLALEIIKAVYEVPGISGQSLNVVDYVQADLLNEMLKPLLEG